MANIHNIFNEINNLVNDNYLQIESSTTENEKIIAEISFKYLEDLIANGHNIERMEYLERESDIDEQESISSSFHLQSEY